MRERFENRFVRAPVGWAFIAEDGQAYPLTEAEAVQLRSEGIAQYDVMLARRKYSQWVLIIVFIILFWLVRSIWPGRSKEAVIAASFGITLLHGYMHHREIQLKRRIEQMVEVVAKARQPLSPALAAKFPRRSPFYWPTMATSIGAVLYFAISRYRATGEIDPLAMHGEVEWAGKPEFMIPLLAIFALAWAFYSGDRWWERRRRRQIEQPFKPRGRGKDLF